MFRYIEKLRQKPEQTRRKYALGISGSIVFIILIVWAVTLPGQLSREPEQTNDNEPSPFASVFENIKGGINTIKEGFSTANPFSQPAAVSNSSATTTPSPTSSSQATSSDKFNQVIITDPE